MYFFLIILLLVALICSVFFHFRKKKIVCKIQCMDKCQKCCKVEELVKPFGYCFHEECGFFSSTLDAWQREAGYAWIYDYMAPRFQMVFDALPVYFDYEGKTWLIEFWKGQYGINAGAEIGIYHADRILSEKEYKTTRFEAVSNTELLNCSFVLCGKNGSCVKVAQNHWWLTAFFTGSFVWPSDLCMKATIKFPDKRMQFAFISGLRKAGCAEQNFSVSGFCVTVHFGRARKVRYKLCTRFWRCFSQWKNKIFCKLYLWVTKPFQCTEDRVLCLYYLIPFAFRRLFRIRRFNKRCHRKERCCRKRCCRKGRL